MPLAPERYCRHLSKESYHPRSSKHGDFLAQSVLADLLDNSPKIRSAAAAGKVVYSLNYDVQVADARAKQTLSADALKDLAWNIDLAIGPPAGTVPPRNPTPTENRLLPPTAIREGELAEIWLMLDAKGVMTEHGKARRNRQRDLTALWAVMHTFYPEAVVGAAIPINMASKFRSPLRDETTTHHNIVQLVAETLSIFRAVRRKTKEVSDSGIEGVGCFVVDFSNLPGAKAKLVTKKPAPQDDDPIRYENFVKSLVRHVEDRFGSKMV